MDEYHHTGSVRRFPYLQIKQRLCGFQHRRVCKLLPQAVRNKSITPRFQERGYYPHTRLYPHLSGLDKLCQECETYGESHKLLGPPNYYQVFTNNKHDDAIKEISLQMEGLVEEMSNTKDGVLLNLLNNYPFLSVKAHKSVSDNRWLNLLIGIIVPAGLLIWLNIWRYRVRLDKDLKTIVKNSRDIQERIKTTF